VGWQVCTNAPGWVGSLTNFLPGLGSNHDPPDLYLLISVSRVSRIIGLNYPLSLGIFQSNSKIMLGVKVIILYVLQYNINLLGTLLISNNLSWALCAEYCIKHCTYMVLFYSHCDLDLLLLISYTPFIDQENKTPGHTVRNWSVNSSCKWKSMALGPFLLLAFLSYSFLNSHDDWEQNVLLSPTLSSMWHPPALSLTEPWPEVSSGRVLAERTCADNYWTFVMAAEEEKFRACGNIWCTDIIFIS
jgi:hypothetical protein